MILIFRSIGGGSVPFLRILRVSSRTKSGFNLMLMKPGPAMDVEPINGLGGRFSITRLAMSTEDMFCEDQYSAWS